MTIVDEFRRNEDRVLDRLVDGELSPDQRRELMAALDDEPGGWRRCALAFLEAQTWRWQLSRMATEPLISQASVTTEGARIRRRRRWAWGLSLAAGLLAAFSLGTRFPMRPAQEVAIAQNEPTLEPIDPGVEALGAVDDATEAEESAWETLTVASADGDELQLRVLNSQEGDEEAAWLSAAQSSVSTRLLRELEAAGWEVDRQRRLVPIVLSDGRRMVVPVEEVDIRYPQVAQF